MFRCPPRESYLRQLPGTFCDLFRCQGDSVNNCFPPEPAAKVRSGRLSGCEEEAPHSGLWTQRTRDGHPRTGIGRYSVCDSNNFTMPTKGGKPKGQGAGAKKKGTGAKKGVKRATGGKKKKKEKSSKSEVEVDILSPAAMFNLYYISHNVPSCLAYRGFLWPGRPKKKGRK